MNLNDLITGATEYHRQHPSQRAGQAAFNYVNDVLPDDMIDLAYTDADPFYYDENLGRFWNAVAERIS
jgi:hypothetical protein